MSRLGIFGASGHGKVIAEAALLSGWKEVFFFDDAWPKAANNSHWPIIGGFKELLSNWDDYDGAIVAIGDNKTRQEKSLELIEAGITLVTIVHPSATVSDFSQIGVGCFIAANSVLNVDTVINDLTIVNSSAVIEHDCKIGEACHISPAAALAGGVSIGNRTWVGINSSVRQEIKIGNDVIVGAGSVVVKDLPPSVRVVGNPVRELLNN